MCLLCEDIPVSSVKLVVPDAVHDLGQYTVQPSESFLEIAWPRAAQPPGCRFSGRCRTMELHI